MNFSKKSDACLEKIGQMNNHFCYSHVFNLDNNNLDPIHCRKSSNDCVSTRGSLIKTFIFQTIGDNPDLQDCSNIWKPYVQQNVELFGTCLSKTSQNSLFNTKTTLSFSKLSTKRISKKTEQINNTSLVVQTKYTKIEQKKIQPVKMRNNRNCYPFGSENKRFAVIDELETIKELNNWQPRGDFEDTRVEESPVEKIVEDGLDEYILQIIDEILSMVDNEAQKNDLLKQSSVTNEYCCCCHCGLPIRPQLDNEKKKPFYCNECGLENDCICSVLEKVFECLPCKACGFEECICSTLEQIICSECGLDDCICDTLNEVVTETKLTEDGEICLCGCNVIDCICCSLQLYLDRSTEKLEFSPVDKRNVVSYACGCNIQGCICLRFQADDEQMDSLCSSSCDSIDCICRKVKSSGTMRNNSVMNIICDIGEANEQSTIVDTKEEKYDCRRFVNYYIKNQQNKLRYQLEKNRNLIDKQNGNYCAICGYFNCPCKLANASSSTTIIYDM